MAAVHELAEQLGRELFALVQRQSERAAQALELAKDKLRAELEGSDGQEREGSSAPTPVRSAGTALRRPVREGQGVVRGSGRGRRAGDSASTTRAARTPQRCRKCVEAGRPGVGHNARTCGREPRSSGSDDDAEDESPVA